MKDEKKLLILPSFIITNVESIITRTHCHFQIAWNKKVEIISEPCQTRDREKDAKFFSLKVSNAKPGKVNRREREKENPNTRKLKEF